MDKEAWLKAKIEKIMAEGINGKSVSQEEAVAVANSMWEQMQQKSHMARMPIFPAKPCKTVDGRNVTQDQIDAVLAYDAAIRPAILKLNSGEAHGSANGPALATIDKTYADGAWIYGDLTAQAGYAEILPALAGKSGPYPFRSVELDRLELNGQKRLYLESVALCGAERPALNLPSAEFSKQTFTISLTGDESMPETETTKKPEPEKEPTKVDFAKLREADLAEFAKVKGDLEKQIAEERAARLAVEARQEVKEFFAAKLSRKVRSAEREDLIALALSMPAEGKATFAAKEMTPRAAFLASLEARQDLPLPELKVVAGGTGSEIGQAEEMDPEKAKMAKINEAAKEAGLDVKTMDGYDRAYTLALRKHPEIFAKKQGVV